MFDPNKYKTLPQLSQEYGYSISHLRLLARRYKNGDIDKGLKAYKFRRQWLVSVEEANLKLTLNAKMEYTNDPRNQRKQGPSTYSALTDPLEGL